MYTYAQIMDRINTMQCFDNYKLVGYLMEHGVEILYCTPSTICVNTKYTQHGKLKLTSEVISANMVSVRNYLGY